MPIYNFWCPEHEKREQIIAPMSEYDGLKKPVCPICEAQMEREFSPPHVINDDFANPLPLTTLLSTKTDNPRALDYAHSRSELNKCIDNQERILGFKVEQAL